MYDHDDNVLNTLKAVEWLKTELHNYIDNKENKKYYY